MHNKTKANEADGSSRLSEITTNKDDEADDPLPKSARKNISVSALGNKEANTPRVLEKLGPPARHDARTTLPGVTDTVFSCLKISDGEPADLRSADRARNRNNSDVVAAVGPHEKYAHAEALAFGARFAGPERRDANGHIGREEEDFSVERRLARKLTSRFDEPVPAPRQTFVTALMPYMAATGFFVFVAGGAAIYYTEAGPSSGLETAGNALAP